MNYNLRYFYPVVRQSFNDTQPALWSEVQDKWSQKDYKVAVRALLAFLGVKDPENNDHFVLAHGSVVIHLYLQEKDIDIRAPFLDISEGQRMPLLRQAAQLNYEPLTISSIQLSGNELIFHFNTPYELCDPYKLFDVLKEMCIHADLYDDSFIRRFKAKRIIAPRIRPFPPEIQSLAIQHFRQILQDTVEAISYLEQNRQHIYQWDIYTLLLLRIDDNVCPNGHIRGLIEKGIADMHSPVELSEKLLRGKALLKTFLELTDEQVSEDLYAIETLVPLKERATAETVKTRLNRILIQIDKEYQQNDFLACNLTAAYHILYLLYEFTLDDQHYTLIKDILPAASGQLLRKAAEDIIRQLRQAVATITEEKISLPGKKKSSFYN